MVFSILEFVDVAIMVAIIGFLFKDMFRMPKKGDVLEQYRNIKQWTWQDFWWACAIIAPSILLHELGHKFTAMYFGLDATFHAACSVQDALAGNLFTFICNIQLFAVLMKFMGYGFLIFVPAFVSISGAAAPLQHAIIAAAGPLVHLVLWLGIAWYMQDKKRVRRLKKQQVLFLFFCKKVNMFLFILNVIPIPGFDGFWIFTNLFKVLF
ncbi:MAG: M50 family metallopeptidase [Candidatus Woesearchaeota archaeon]|nr:M50 family metallopeptidase [Candidatus Woesearchaeota archaeon]